ncbi:response regulator [Rhodoferax aquaticus]|uniref:Sensory/regulatory protein RpfC n=1 Tax=Rhodoferax aquaticus TaxID=2527691 RepID=A0A515EQX6_9BURK|nr:response regulator [Rhodoferax aquaticus]QDL55066.1 sensor histidine kinase [Rhodoferax aquaticus]
MSVVPPEQDDDWLIDDADPETGPQDANTLKPWRILIVDDEPDIHLVTRMALNKVMSRGRPIEILSAYSGAQGFEILSKESDIALVLLDVVMETDHAGLMLAQDIRKQLDNQMVRIVLRTGQAGQAPEESVIVDYDINDYKSKTELTQSKLFVTVVASLRAYEGLVAIEHHYFDMAERERVENELRSAKEAAETIAASKGQFLANMSHEIRTPMNAILGMLKLLQDTDLNPRQLEYTDKTEGAAKSLLGLLNDILDFSKIDAGKMVLDPQPFAMDQLLRNLAVIFSASLGKKPLELMFDVDPHVPSTLVGDAMRLQQVLINLGGNAIKFTHQGEITLQVKVLQASEASIDLHFAMKDTGIGIAAEQRSNIFADFTQAEASTTRRYGGTGLGLSISQRLVNLMGGTLELDSTLGHGSDFHFQVTMGMPEVQADAPWVAGTGLDTLLIEDHPTARALTTRMLESLGWTVDAVAGGAQALAHLQARLDTGVAPYQVVFVDWAMPGMDGWETMAAMRSMLPVGQSPIMVMLSGHGRNQLSDRSLQEQSELNAFLVKPITAGMLRDVVQQAQEGRSNVRAIPRPKTEKPRRLQGLRLLLVEDNLINQQVARELLAAAGAIVDIAENGQEGVDAVVMAKPAYDLVLMDVQMPVMDGFEATQRIRQNPAFAKLPIVAMTANAMASDRDACLAAGMDAHVGKPFDLTELISVILDHTKRKEGGAYSAVGAVAPGKQTVEAGAPSEIESLPRTDAVNVKGALAHMDDSVELYVGVLDEYLRDLALQPDKLDAALQRKDLLTATRMLHTLKGLSTMVGASYMAAIAKKLERDVKAADKTLDVDAVKALFRAAVNATQQSMAPIAQQLRAHLPASAEPTKVLDRERVVKDLSALLAMLEQDDMEAVEVYAVLRQAHPGLTGRWWDTLATTMADLDFVAAAQACQMGLDQLA